MNHNFGEKSPIISKEAYVCDGVHIIGDVHIEALCSIWYGAILRGDDNYIKIGEGSNIQDNCIVHVSKDDKPTIIGKNVTVGHGVIIHGAVIEDCSLIGMGSIILDGAHIGKNTIVGAGSLIPQGKVIPDGVLCMGSPARVIRNLSEEEIENIKLSALHYINLREKNI